MYREDRCSNFDFCSCYGGEKEDKSRSQVTEMFYKLRNILQKLMNLKHFPWVNKASKQTSGSDYVCGNRHDAQVGRDTSYNLGSARSA